jgi:hypothetical protein
MVDESGDELKDYKFFALTEFQMIQVDFNRFKVTNEIYIQLTGNSSMQKLIIQIALILYRKAGKTRRNA